MDKMTKNTLVEKLNEKGYSKNEGKEIVDMIFEFMQEGLAEGKTIDIYGFGKFEVNERAERMGQNPLTKEKIVIPACKVVKFKAAKKLKDLVK